MPLRIFALDLTERSELAGLEQALALEKPRVKFLVNAAGFGKMGPVSGQTVKEDADMVRLNCEALTAVTRMVLPYMDKNSRIIQYASSAAFLPQPDFAVYAATKAYVLSYSRALNRELKGPGHLRDRRVPRPGAHGIFSPSPRLPGRFPSTSAGDGKSKAGGGQGCPGQHCLPGAVCLWLFHEGLFPAGKDRTP